MDIQPQIEKEVYDFYYRAGAMNKASLNEAFANAVGPNPFADLFSQMKERSSVFNLNQLVFQPKLRRITEEASTTTGVDFTMGVTTHMYESGYFLSTWLTPSEIQTKTGEGALKMLNLAPKKFLKSVVKSFLEDGENLDFPMTGTKFFSTNHKFLNSSPSKNIVSQTGGVTRDNISKALDSALQAIMLFQYLKDESAYDSENRLIAICHPKLLNNLATIATAATISSTDNIYSRYGISVISMDLKEENHWYLASISPLATSFSRPFILNQPDPFSVSFYGKDSSQFLTSGANRVAGIASFGYALGSPANIVKVKQS